MKDYILLKNGMKMPRFGMGTWYLGEQKSKEKDEVEALRAGLDEGIQLIDTAEMYGHGLSEALIGKAIEGYDRKSLFLVSKVYPHNAGKRNIEKSLNQTLKNLNTDYLDLYLLHWRGMVPFSETVECMEELVRKGKIKSWGVSNLDTDDMEELFSVPNGDNCVVNQVLYHIGSRGIEYDLLPWLKRHNVATMAYCPLAQAGLLRRDLLQNKNLKEVANKHKITVMQLLLAFVLQDENIIAIPRSSNKDHVLENYEVKDIVLSKEDMDLINEAYPAPTRKTYLDIV